MVHRIARVMAISGYAVWLSLGCSVALGWAAVPTVVLHEPEDRAVLSGTVVLNAEVTGPFTIKSVLFARAIRTVLGVGTLEPGSALYELEFDTTTTPNGNYLVYAMVLAEEISTQRLVVAYSAQRTISINNPIDLSRPDVLLQEPIAGAVLAGDVLVKADATDNVGVASVSFYVDGSAEPFAIDAEAPYEASWNTRAVTNGAHTIRAIAADAAGNVDIHYLTVTVVNGPAPFAAILSPRDKSTVKAGQSVMIEATAASIEGIDRVEFFVNGSRKCVDRQADNGLYTCAWKVPKRARAYTLKAKATDRIGGAASTTIIVNGEP